MNRIETIVREALCDVLKRPLQEQHLLDLNDDLRYGFGLTSLDLIMTMTSLCAKADIALTDFDEEDIARLQSPADIVELLSAKVAG